MNESKLQFRFFKTSHINKKQINATTNRGNAKPAIANIQYLPAGKNEIKQADKYSNMAAMFIALKTAPKNFHMIEWLILNYTNCIYKIAQSYFINLQWLIPILLAFHLASHQQYITSRGCI
jgi:hypothetical protein